MADFGNNLTSISWWIGVVIVGILVNLVAIYLKSPLDQLLTSISTKYQTRTKAKKAEREKEIMNLTGNKHEQILHASKTNSTLVISVLYCVVGILSPVITLLFMIIELQTPAVKGSLVFKIFLTLIIILGVFILFQGVVRFTEALNDQEILKEAKDRESKVEPK